MLNEHGIEIISIIFGSGGIGYAIISRWLDRRKYNQEVRSQAAEADVKGDEFWKNRYDVLNEEVQRKDNWWKERYDNLYNEMQNERQTSNEIIRNFRAELNNIRDEYEEQRRKDKEKYEELQRRYEALQEESDRKLRIQIDRVTQLENLLKKYEAKNSKS